jgi:adenine-specific DNA-methyltransferase
MAAGLSKTKWNATLPMGFSMADSSLDVQLAYEGKKTELDILATEPAETSAVWQGHAAANRLYYGENLSILSLLLKDDEVRGKIRLIYIDPPYATRGVFQTRSQQDAYVDLLEGNHYIEFIRERLILLRELLAPDGSIYVHLDENMAFYVKVVMDEVFGKSNFRNWITRKKCNPKNYTRKTYGDISDYILFYTKSDEYAWNRAYDKWTDEKALKEYSYIEEGTGRRYKKVPVHAPGTRNGETGKAWRGMMPPSGKHWQYTPETLDAMDARGEIFWSSNGNPRRKVYLDESEGIPAQDIWLDFKDAHNQNIEITGYPTEKNPAILKRVIEASSNPGDLVLDCFSGSGTTLDVASQLKRHWIGVDNSLEAIKATLHRFAHGIQPMGDYVGKKMKTSSQTLPLFRITDFSLYTETPRKDELAELIGQWREWINAE